jgi:alpha,alpha-trehalase
LLAVEGMRRYGYRAEADRIARAWIETVAENFHHDDTVREKYNVVTRSSEAEVTAGYEVNVVGFGWTNAVVLEFAHQLHLRLSDTVGPE